MAYGASRPRSENTAYDSKNVADELLTDGAMDYMPKPLSVEGLVKKVETILRKKGKI